MEAELRKIIAKYDDSLETVRWEEMQLPAFQEQRRATSLAATREPTPTLKK
jgi:hypothetical protein